MVIRLGAFIAFLIFCVEVTPYSSILTLGASKTVVFTALIVSAAAMLIAIGKLKFTLISFILLALAANELAMGALNDLPSINFVRITAALLASMLIFSSDRLYNTMLKGLRISHILLVGGFVVATFAVAVLGSGVLSGVFPLSDPSVFRKIDYAGALRVQSLGIFHFTLNAAPPLNPLGINVLPSGSAAEPHPFFSFILITTLILLRQKMMDWRVLLASGVALVLSFSMSNGIGLAGAAAVTLLVYLAQKLRARRIVLALMAVGAIALFVGLWRSGYLQPGNIAIALNAFDRSVAESYATLVRFFALTNGRYPLEAVPHYFNEFTIFPLAASSFLLFLLFLAGIFARVFKVAKKLSYIDIFLLSYVFAYSLKSFGVTIFQPFILVSILIVLHRTQPALSKNKRRRPAAKATGQAPQGQPAFG